MRVRNVLLFAVFVLVSKEILLPLSVGAYYYFPYQQHVIDCDTAMEDSWYYKDNTLDKSEKIQLLDCHEYDKARKVMLMSGLPEEYLSYLGLKALELYQRPAEEFVRLHRFRER